MIMQKSQIRKFRFSRPRRWPPFGRHDEHSSIVFPLFSGQQDSKTEINEVFNKI